MKKTTITSKRIKNPSLAIGKGFSLLGDDAKIKMQQTLMRIFNVSSTPSFCYMLNGQKVFNTAEKERIESEFAKHNVPKSEVWGIYTKKPKREWLKEMGH